MADERTSPPSESAPPVPSLFVAGLDEILLVLVLVGLLLGLHGRWTSTDPLKGQLRGRSALSPNGSLLASTLLHFGGVFDLERARFLYLLQDEVFSLEFSTDGRMLLLAELDGEVRILEARSGRTLQHFRVKTWFPETVCLHPDGDLVAAVGRDGPIEIWDRREPELYRQIDPQMESVVHISFARSAGLLCVAGWDERGGCVIQLWDVRTTGPPTTLRTPQLREGWDCVAVSPDASMVALVVGEPPTLSLWDVSTGALSTLMPTPETSVDPSGGPIARVEGLKFSRTGRYIFLAMSGRHIAIWDLQTDSPKEVPKARQWLDLGDVRFLDGDRTMAMGGGLLVEFRDVETSELLREVEPPVLLRKYHGSGWRRDWIAPGLWLILWVLAYRRRRLHPERPTGRRDRGVVLLPFVAGIWLAKGELIAAVVKGSGRLISFDVSEPFQFVPPAIVFTLLLAPGLFSSILLLLGFTRRFRSRLVFTVPSLGIAAWTLLVAPPVGESIWSLLLLNLR